MRNKLIENNMKGKIVEESQRWDFKTDITKHHY